MRAIAVLLVVFYHAGIGPAAGYIGVDVFFVISGYLITLLLVDEWTRHRRIDLAGFYARRVRRLMPALATTIAGTLLLSVWLLPPEALRATLQSAAAASLFSANLFFQANTGGYFDTPSNEMPLLHLWSLAVEEQFYLLWPLLLIFILRRRPRALAVALAGLMVASFLCSEWLLATHAEAAFFQMPSRFWELALGGLLAVSAPRRRAAAPVALLGLAVIAAAGLVSFSRFPGAGALPATAGAALLLWAIHGGGDLGLCGRALRSSLMTLIGRLSYSLYLWHWPLLALYHATSINPGSGASLALCALSLALAAATYRYVEVPARTGVLSAGSRKVLAAGIASAALAAVALVATAQFYLQEERLQAADDPAAYRAEHDVTRYRRGCDYKPMDEPTRLPRPGCTSRGDATPAVAIWGDSYASAWQPIAWKIAGQAGVAAADYSRSGCPPYLGRFSEVDSYRDRLCREHNARVAEWVRGLETLVIVVRWDARPRETNERELRRTLAAVAPHVGRVLVLGPSPVMPEELPKCLRLKVDSCQVTRASFEQQAAPTRAGLKQVLAAHGNVEYVELADFLCRASLCPGVLDGQALYSDESHVSYGAATRFAEQYVRFQPAHSAQAAGGGPSR